MWSIRGAGLEVETDTTEVGIALAEIPGHSLAARLVLGAVRDASRLHVLRYSVKSIHTLILWGAPESVACVDLDRGRAPRHSSNQDRGDDATKLIHRHVALT